MTPRIATPWRTMRRPIIRLLPDSGQARIVDGVMFIGATCEGGTIASTPGRRPDPRIAGSDGSSAAMDLWEHCARGDMWMKGCGHWSYVSFDTS